MKVVDVYPYIKIKDEILLGIFLRKKSKLYGGQWRMIGGKIISREKAWQAGLRELREETGVDPLLFWTIPSVNHFYDHTNDEILYIPAFAAQIADLNVIQLNDEHEQVKWISISEIENYIFWPEQRKLFSLLHYCVTHNSILPEWIIPLSE